MCWTEEIHYLGRSHAEPCDHRVKQASHRCMRARLQIGSRLLGWAPSSRYVRSRGGKLLCARRETVTRRVRGLCPDCDLRWRTLRGPYAQYFSSSSSSSHPDRPRRRNGHDPTVEQAEDVARQQEAERRARARADHEARARAAQALHQAERLQRARLPAAGPEGRRTNRDLDAIRAQALRRAAAQQQQQRQQRRTVDLPPPAPAPATVNRLPGAGPGLEWADPSIVPAPLCFDRRSRPQGNWL